MRSTESIPPHDMSKQKSIRAGFVEMLMEMVIFLGSVDVMICLLP